MDFINKRSIIRVDANMPVNLRTDRNPLVELQALALNISVYGMSVMCQIPLLLGEMLRIKLPNEWGNLLLEASVIRQEGKTFCCQFVDVSPENCKALDDGVYKIWRQGRRTKAGKASASNSFNSSQSKTSGSFNVFI